MEESAVVVLSGGQDSAVCLYWALSKGYNVSTITFNYGQRHSIELESAKKIARLAGVSNYIINIPNILKGASPLVSDNDLKQYNSYVDIPSGVDNTFVPLRNQLFITVAANYAYSYGIRNLVFGACKDDYDGYPDCRRSFIQAIELACNLGTFTDKPLKIITPLLEMSKRETVELALSLKGCMEALAYSHTAYDGKYPPTSKDHASLLRAKGFEEAGVRDPLIVRAVNEGLMSVPDSDIYRG